MSEEKAYIKLESIYDPSGEISITITCKSSLQCPKAQGPAPAFNQLPIKGPESVLFTTKSPEPSTQPDTWQALDKCSVN